MIINLFLEFYFLYTVIYLEGIGTNQYIPLYKELTAEPQFPRSNYSVPNTNFPINTLGKLLENKRIFNTTERN